MDDKNVNLVLNSCFVIKMGNMDLIWVRICFGFMKDENK